MSVARQFSGCRASAALPALPRSEWPPCAPTSFARPAARSQSGGWGVGPGRGGGASQTGCTGPAGCGLEGTGEEGALVNIAYIEYQDTASI